MTIVLNNAVLLIGGKNFSGDCNEISVSYSAEMLDETAMGDTTRVRKGGLTTVAVNAKGFVSFGTGDVDDLLFTNMGVAGSMTLFPSTPVPGSATGFAVRAVEGTYVVGGAIGTVLPFTLSAEGAGTV